MVKDAVVDGYLATLNSDLTRKLYRYDICCLGESSGCRPHEATFEQCKAHFERMRESGMANSTVMRHIASTRSFFRWVVAHGYRADNPMVGMTAGPSENGAKIILPLAKEVDALKRAAMARCTDTGMRLYLCLLLTTKHGMPLEPCVRLTTAEVRKIIGTPEALVGEYLDRCAQTPFINKHGDPITGRSMRRLLIALCIQAEVTKLDWRELRYYAVRAALEAGEGDREVGTKFGVTQGTLAAIRKAEWA